MSINKDLIEVRIDIIERNLKFLKEYKNISVKNFLESYKDIQAAKFSLFEIIEACIDIASHIISSNGFERAESYSEMFEVLGNHEILDSTMKEKLKKIAKFRNFLVHKYPDVDNSLIIKYIKVELGDIKEYIKSILIFLKND